MRGLIVGGTSPAGVGQACHLWLQEDKRFEGVEWDVPDPNGFDVSDEQSMHFWMRRYDLNGEFEGYDYILYSAGVNQLCYAEDEDTLGLADTFTVNTFGFIRTLGIQRKLYPGKEFSAVAIVSDAMRTPMRGSVAYCASKAALAMAVRCLAREWAPACRVNGVAPGVVEGTTMSNYIDATVPSFRGWSSEQAKDYEQSMQPFKRRVHTLEVAEVVANTLYGPHYMSGSIVEITGAK